MKKVISLLLAVVMVVGVMSISAFAAPIAAGQAGFNMTLDKTEYAAGDTIRLTLNTLEKLRCAEAVEITFDNSKVDFKGFKSIIAGQEYDVPAGNEKSWIYYESAYTGAPLPNAPTINTTYMSDYVKTDSTIGFTTVPTAGSSSTVYFAKTLFIAEFTVKSTAKGTISFVLYENSAEKDYETTGYAGDVETKSVTVKSNTPAATITVADPSVEDAKMTWEVTATPSLINALTAKLYYTETGAEDETEAVSLSWAETWTGDGDCVFNVITNLQDADKAQYTELEVASGTVSGRN